MESKKVKREVVRSKKKKIEIKPKQETINVKENIDDVVNKIGMTFTSAEKDEKKSSSYKYTREYWEDLYHSSQNGSLIDNIETLSGVKRIRVEDELGERVPEIMELFERENIINRIGHIIKNKLVYGNEYWLISWKSGQIDIKQINYSNVTVEVSDTDVNDEEFYTVKMEGNVSGQSYRWHYQNYDKWRWEKPITRTTDVDNQPINLEKEGVIIHKKFNDLSSDSSGYSIFMRLNTFGEALENYLRDTEKITKHYRSSFLDITVPLANEIDKATGMDMAVKTAGERYKKMEIGSNVVHGEGEKWEVKEYPNKQVDSEVRRGFTLYLASVFGGGEIMFGDASNVNYSTAQTQLLLFREALRKYQEDVRDIIKKTLYIYYKEELGKEMGEIQINFPNPLDEIDRDDNTIKEYHSMFKDGTMPYNTLMAKMGLDGNNQRKLLKKDKTDQIINGVVEKNV